MNFNINNVIKNEIENLTIEDKIKFLISYMDELLVFMYTNNKKDNPNGYYSCNFEIPQEYIDSLKLNKIIENKLSNDIIEILDIYCENFKCLLIDNLIIDNINYQLYFIIELLDYIEGYNIILKNTNNDDIIKLVYNSGDLHTEYYIGQLNNNYIETLFDYLFPIHIQLSIYETYKKSFY